MRQTRLICWIGFAIGILAAAAPGFGADKPRSASKLNVLFIAIDDLNCNVGCYGNPLAKTPNIDRLGRRGVRFDRAYCQVALCNPSRTSLLSGRRPDTTQVYDNITPPRTTLGPVVFLPEYFRAQGYFTARVGKIAHGSYESAVTWDVAEDRRGRVRKIRRDGAEEAALPKNSPPRATPVFTWKMSNAADADHVDGQTARRIAALLREHHGGPFFIAAGFHKPHLPWIAPRKYFEMFSRESMLLPDNPADLRRHIPPLALITTRPDGAQLSERDNREGIAAYLACTAFVDAQVGILLQTVDELGLWDNTIVVLWGDHGWHLGDHGGLWGKLTVFEEAARVPLIVAAPGKQAGVASPRLVELIDLYPTLTELCGIPLPRNLEGTSFVPLLREPTQPWKKATFTQVFRDKAELEAAGNHGATRGVMGRSVRTEQYRYTEWGNPAVAELYDHDHDPHELHNLASDPQHGPTLAELRSVLKLGWRAVADEVEKSQASRPRNPDAAPTPGRQ